MPAKLFLYNSTWKDKMEEDEEIWADMDRFLTEGTMDGYNKKNLMYYKKFMTYKAQEKYESMLKIANDGRKLALDQRLINDMLPDEDNSKATIDGSGALLCRGQS